MASSIKTFNALLDTRILASSFDSHAVAVTPSGETVATKYGIPDSLRAEQTYRTPRLSPAGLGQSAEYGLAIGGATYSLKYLRGS